MGKITRIRASRLAERLGELEVRGGHEVIVDLLRVLDHLHAEEHNAEIIVATSQNTCVRGASPVSPTAPRTPSSMAFAVRSAQTGQAPRTQVFWLVATMILGVVFLGVKVVEYADKINHHLVPGPHFQFAEPFGQTAQLYFSLYFAMTGLHATHMIIGIGIMAVIAWQAGRGKFGPKRYMLVEITGCTGTSSIWCGSSSSRRSISSAAPTVDAMSGYVAPKSLYILIFLALMVGTALTVAVTYVHLAPSTSPSRSLSPSPRRCSSFCSSCI